MKPFSISRLPCIEFGRGSLGKVPDLITAYGRQVLLVTGSHSFTASAAWPRLRSALRAGGIAWEHVRVTGEPSPQWVDDIVRAYGGEAVDVVLAIGGGSALDGAKAIAGLLRCGHSVMDYLEGVGAGRTYEGSATPMIAVPTTAGTGSEATKNAVLSVQGEAGFKKSFRDDALVPTHTIVDPDLLSTCPRSVIAANGMDALTQLLESYVSLKANPVTDSLSISGLERVRDALPEWYEKGAEVRAAQEGMAYAALLSGITLAQCGLGSVHGLASPLGAFYPIPHGVVCGTLVAAATETNIQAMRDREPGNPALARYAHAAEVLCGRRFQSPEAARTALVDLLGDWTRRMELPPLSHFGLDEAGISKVVSHARGSSMKTNPIELLDDEIAGILMKRL